MGKRERQEDVTAMIRGAVLLQESEHLRAGLVEIAARLDNYSDAVRAEVARQQEEEKRNV